MGSSASSAAPLPLGLSLPADTHRHPNQNFPLLLQLPIVCASCSPGHLSQVVVFYLASGSFPGPPLSPCGASILKKERCRCKHA